MKIIITRSFERTRQIADFVPIKAYCEVSFEQDFPDGAAHEAIVEAMSSKADELCRSEVDKTLMSYQPLCIVCGGRGAKVNLNKEGVCGQCVKDLASQAAGFRKNN